MRTEWQRISVTQTTCSDCTRMMVVVLEECPPCQISWQLKMRRKCILPKLLASLQVFLLRTEWQRFSVTQTTSNCGTFELHNLPIYKELTSGFSKWGFSGLSWGCLEGSIGGCLRDCYGGHLGRDLGR